IDRARVDAQRAEHALGVVDLEAVDPEALADGVLDLLDVDAVDRTGAGALVAADASRQIETVEAAIAGLHGDRQLWIFKLLSEGPALVRLEEIPERDVHALPDGLDGEIDVAEPLPHGILVVPKQRTGRSLLMIIGPAPAPARCGQAPAQASAAQSTNDC